jgi:hypothetical protein
MAQQPARQGHHRRRSTSDWPLYHGSDKSVDLHALGGILSAVRTASLDQVVNVLAVALRDVAVAQQALQPPPRRQA